MRKISILLACLMLSACAIKFNLTPQEKAAMDAQIATLIKDDRLTLAEATRDLPRRCSDGCYLLDAAAYRVVLKWFGDISEKAYLAGRDDEAKGKPLYDPSARR